MCLTVLKVFKLPRMLVREGFASDRNPGKVKEVKWGLRWAANVARVFEEGDLVSRSSKTRGLGLGKRVPLTSPACSAPASYHPFWLSCKPEKTQVTPGHDEGSLAYFLNSWNKWVHIHCPAVWSFGETREPELWGRLAKEGGTSTFLPAHKWSGKHYATCLFLCRKWNGKSRQWWVRKFNFPSAVFPTLTWKSWKVQGGKPWNNPATSNSHIIISYKCPIYVKKSQFWLTAFLLSKKWDHRGGPA